MKKLLLFILPLLVTGCIKDMGNYDYDYLPDVHVTNLSDESPIAVRYGEEIYFIPLVETEIPTSELSFTWYIQRYQQRDTISLERHLKCIADMEGGRLILEIKHDASDVRWLFGTILDIVQPYQRGWAILTKEGTRSHLNFLEQTSILDYTYIPKLFYLQNNSYLPSNCLAVKGTRNASLWLVHSENEVHLLNAETIKTKELMSKMMTEPLNPFNPTEIGFSNDELSHAYRVLAANGQLFTVPYTSNIPSEINFKYNLPVEGDYYVSDKVAKAGTKQILAFDEKHQRYLFVVVKPGRTIATVPAVDQGSLPINPGDLQQECVWMANNRYWVSNTSFNLNSILKDAEGNYSLQRLRGADFTIKLERLTSIPRTVINENTQIAYNDLNGNILFYNNNIIHVYNATNDTFTENWMQVEENILNIALNDDYMAIATSRGTNSRFRVLRGSLEVVNQLVDGQIISMDYKAE